MADENSTSSDDEKAAPAATRNSALPLFYSKPVPLSAPRHAGKHMANKITYEFARRNNSVPINAVEFALTSKQYPIVFTSSDPVAAVAVFGLKEGQNLFVDDKGEWLQGVYIPAYVRRYPFIFMTSGDRQQFTLCVDEDSPFVTTGGGQALYNNDEPTEVVQSALEFCKSFQGHFDATQVLCAELVKHDLLVPNRADVVLKSGERLGLGGFRVIDETKFNELPDDVFLDWRKKGWLHVIYSHLLSQSNWSNLVRLVAAPDDAEEKQ